ncbi:hypothetical protein GCM10010177_13150 [Actinomadura citrea]|nr:hypothetical protein GCM10010177_13150 [Actinomadura citrea]
MHTLYAATATATGTPAPMLILLAIIGTAVYLVSCFIWPFRPCSRCDGAGRFRSPSGRAWRYCHRCSGKGAQLRAGRRILTYLGNTRDRGTRH